MPAQETPSQIDIWNGPRALGWVEEQELLDRIFTPFEAILADAAAGASNVLDVGCGTGATSLAIARRLGEHGHCTGIDISEPMLTLARARAQQEATPPTFLQADAQTHPFESATFDLVVSRFGVMFFDDPVAAFANLRRATKQGGALNLIVWRDPADNPFMTVAEQAAAPFLPELPPRKPDAPGQFGFADVQRVRGILTQAGWTNVDMQPVDVACAFPTTNLERYFTRLGPLRQALTDADEATRVQVIAAVRPAFDPFVHGDEVRFTAACWSISARAGS